MRRRQQVLGSGAVAIALVLGACAGAPGTAGKPAAKASAKPSVKTPSPSPKATTVPSPVPSLGLLLEGRVTVAPAAILDAKLGQVTAQGVKIIANNSGGYRLATGFLMVLPVITLIGWDALPQRSRDLCLTLTDRAVATIADIDALEVF